VVLACDFLTVETVWLTRIYVLFFVSLDAIGQSLLLLQQALEQQPFA
jgi:hypothetical protein